MSKVFSKIIEVILNILIFIAVIILIVASMYMVQTKIWGHDYADIFGYTVFQISTGSMSPTIEAEDIIVVKLTKDFENNDIVVFKEEKNLITHRIVKIESDSVVTKGDANNSEDKQIKRDMIIGKVIKIIPNISIWKKVLGTPEVFISISIAILLFGIAFSYKGKQTKKDEYKSAKINNEIKKKTKGDSMKES